FHMTNSESVNRARCYTDTCPYDDCQYMRYEPKIYFQMNIREIKKQKISTVAVRSFNIPDTIITYQPKLEPEEFLCYLCSIFSLWFGASVVVIGFACVNHLPMYKLKRSRNYQIDGNGAPVEPVRPMEPVRLRTRVRKLEIFA